MVSYTLPVNVTTFTKACRYHRQVIGHNIDDQRVLFLEKRNECNFHGNKWIKDECAKQNFLGKTCLSVYFFYFRRFMNCLSLKKEVAILSYTVLAFSAIAC